MKFLALVAWLALATAILLALLTVFANPGAGDAGLEAAQPVAAAASDDGEVVYRIRLVLLALAATLALRLARDPEP